MGFVNGQVSVAWNIALCTYELYTWPCVLIERCRKRGLVSAHFTAEAEGGLCKWPSFSSMEHCTLHIRAVHMAMCLDREVAEERTGFSSFHCRGWRWALLMAKFQ